MSDPNYDSHDEEFEETDVSELLGLDSGASQEDEDEAWENQMC